MTIEIVANFGKLLRLAKALGIAEKEFRDNPTKENAKAFEDAKSAHDDYYEIIKMADYINIGFTNSALGPR